MEMGIKNDMNVIKFKKYIGSCCGNSFIISDCRNTKLEKKSKADFASKNIEKFGVDSALFLEKSNGFDVLLRIFEKDGSESESCGNGTLLIGYFLGMSKGKIEMRDNGALVANNSKRQSISMNMKFSYIKKIRGKKDCIFVKMGEPHIIYLVRDIKKFDLVGIGKKQQKKYPEGINVDAIQKINDHKYLIRTYERGVFAETKSCGTGSLSS
jgi:diaminopimelate epimerase